MELLSPRLRLVCATDEQLRYLIDGPDAFAMRFEMPVEDEYLDFPDALQWSATAIAKEAEPTLADWWRPYIFILRDAPRVVGLGGYKGPPRDSMLEIGYSIAPSHQRRGLATEAAAALIAHAFSATDVNSVQAHTLAERNASNRLLETCGMVRTAEIDDPNDGKIWRYEITREYWNSRAKQTGT